jgi:hypothetical protein
VRRSGSLGQAEAIGGRTRQAAGAEELNMMPGVVRAITVPSP